MPYKVRSDNKADAIATLIWHIGLAIPDAKAEADNPTNREFMFHPTRRWRIDLAFPSRQIAVEVEGALFKGHRTIADIETITRAGQVLRPADLKALKSRGGRHNNAAGMMADMEKYNEAQAVGWVILRVMPQWVEDGRALAWFESVWNIRSLHDGSTSGHGDGESGGGSVREGVRSVPVSRLAAGRVRRDRR